MDWYNVGTKYNGNILGFESLKKIKDRQRKGETMRKIFVKIDIQEDDFNSCETLIITKYCRVKMARMKQVA